MGLPWVRMDTNLPSHDKILALLADASPKRYQAAASYAFAICWSGGQGTDGRVPAYALAQVHGTSTTAQLLAKYGLWDEAPDGYKIRNFDVRQELSVVTETKKAAAQIAAKKANCVRWHGKDCGCWREVGGSDGISA